MSIISKGTTKLRDDEDIKWQMRSFYRKANFIDVYDIYAHVQLMLEPCKTTAVLILLWK